MNISAENVPAQRHYSFMLKNIQNKLFSIAVKDKFPKFCSILDISEVQNWKKSDTGSIATLLELKVNAEVMTTKIPLYLIG